MWWHRGGGLAPQISTPWQECCSGSPWAGSTTSWTSLSHRFHWVRWWHAAVAKHKLKHKPKAKSHAKGKKEASDLEPEEEVEEAEVPKAQLWCARNRVSIANSFVPISEPHMLQPLHGRIPYVYGRIP